MSFYSTELLISVALLAGNIVVAILTLLAGRRCLPPSENGHACRRQQVVSFVLHFGAGTFLSVCLLILLPDARELFEAHEETRHEQPSGNTLLAHHEGHHENFPLPEFLVLCGFFSTFAVQEFLHYTLYHFRKKNPADPKVLFCSCAKRHTECSKTFKAHNPEQTLFRRERRNTNASNLAELSLRQSIKEPIPEHQSPLMRSSILSQPVPNYGSVTTMATVSVEHPLPIITPQVVIAADGAVAIVRRPQQVQDINTSTSNVILLLVLSIYAIFQGLDIGQTLHTVTWKVVLADCLQQLVVVFIIAFVALYHSEQAWSSLLYVGVLTVMSPVGLLLDMLLGQEMASLSPIMLGSTKALVGGSLMYLTFCDLLKRRQSQEISHISMFAAFAIGATIHCSLCYVSREM